MGHSVHRLRRPEDRVMRQRRPRLVAWCWTSAVRAWAPAFPSLTCLCPVHRQQPAPGQHAPQLWDPDDRDINRSPQLLSFIRGRWWWVEWHSACPSTLLTSVQSLPAPSFTDPVSCISRGSAATVAVHGGPSAITPRSGCWPGSLGCYSAGSPCGACACA